MVDFEFREHYTIDDLRRIVAILRHPGGCPWDAEQTHESLRRCLMEECCEVLEAIDRRDDALLCEELGDVLLQVVFHSRMAQEEGLFTFDDVVDGICKKLVFRHPHVFGTVEAGDADGALTAWEKQKREEKGQKTAADSLDGVARSLPALMRAEKIQDKAKKAGFDWPDISPALDKLSEELGELKTAAAQGSNVEEELGDLLFAAVKVGRFLGLDSELALHAACEKFIRRFRRTEELAGQPMTQMELSDLERFWAQAKRDSDSTSMT